MMFEAIEDLLDVPARLAEFDGVPPRPRQRLQEMIEAFEVDRHVRRKLIEHRPERVLEPPGAAEEALERLLGGLQLLHVRQVTAGLDRVDETFWRAPAPGRESRSLGQPIKGVVDLDRVEPLRVVLEPAALGQLAGIEIAAPMRVLPSGAADTYGWAKLLIAQHLQSNLRRVICVDVSAFPAREFHHQ